MRPSIPLRSPLPLILLVLAAFPLATEARTWHLTSSAGSTDSASCGSSATPCADLSVIWNSLGEGDNVQFDAGTHSSCSNCGTLSSTLSVSVTIQGQGVAVTQINLNSFPTMYTARSLTVRDMLIENGSSSDNGGAFSLSPSTSSQVSFINVVFDSCDSSGHGGAIHVNGGSHDVDLILNNVEARNCFASGDGGFIHVEGSNIGLDIEDLVIAGGNMNNAAGDGGGVAFTGTCGVGKACSIQSFICNNVDASGSGGCLYHEDSVTLTDGEAFDCSASTAGGAFYLEGSTPYAMSDVAVWNCMSGGNGGAVVADGLTEIRRCSFIDNDCSGDGGALALEPGSTTLEDVVVFNNGAGGSGCGIHLDGGAGSHTLSLVRSNITDNDNGVCVGSALYVGSNWDLDFDSNDTAIGGCINDCVRGVSAYTCDTCVLGRCAYTGPRDAGNCFCPSPGFSTTTNACDTCDDVSVCDDWIVDVIPVGETSSSDSNDDDDDDEMVEDSDGDESSTTDEESASDNSDNAEGASTPWGGIAVSGLAVVGLIALVSLGGSKKGEIGDGNSSNSEASAAKKDPYAGMSKKEARKAARDNAIELSRLKKQTEVMGSLLAEKDKQLSGSGSDAVVDDDATSTGGVSLATDSIHSRRAPGKLRSKSASGSKKKKPQVQSSKEKPNGKNGTGYTTVPVSRFKPKKVDTDMVSEATVVSTRTAQAPYFG